MLLGSLTSRNLEPSGCHRSQLPRQIPFDKYKRYAVAYIRAEIGRCFRKHSQEAFTLGHQESGDEKAVDDTALLALVLPGSGFQPVHCVRSWYPSV